MFLPRCKAFPPQKWIALERRSLITRSTSDITNVQNFLTLLLRVGLLAPMMAVSGLVFSAATGGAVSSVLLIAIPVLLIALTIIMVLASRYSIRLRQKLDQINRLFLESLEGVRCDSRL